MRTLVHTHMSVSIRTGHPAPHGERVVLVTGVAGFIGFHISHRLVQEWGAQQVVGLDSFNNYYDVQLKRDRASELVGMGVKVCWPCSIMCCSHAACVWVNRCTGQTCVMLSSCVT